MDQFFTLFWVLFVENQQLKVVKTWPWVHKNGSSNLKQRKYVFCINIDRSTKPSLQMKIFANFLCFSGQLAPPVLVNTHTPTPTHTAVSLLLVQLQSTFWGGETSQPFESSGDISKVGGACTDMFVALVPGPWAQHGLQRWRPHLLQQLPSYVPFEERHVVCSWLHRVPESRKNSFDYASWSTVRV